MKNGSIFALREIDENLYSIQYEKGKPNAFKQIFDDWNDIEYLFDFFEEHITDLHSDFWQKKFGRKISVQEAIQITLNQASNFETSVLNHNSEDLIDELFKQLSKYPFKYLPKIVLNNMAFKAYGTDYASWLRIYAIKIGNVYVITGGAIKLTHQMEERTHTQNEIDKLINVFALLKKAGFDHPDAFDCDYYSFEI